MPAEVRVDPLTGLRAIVATGPPGRELRVAPAAPLDPADDPFAEGNEHLTAPELHAVRPDGGAPDGPGWLVRVVGAGGGRFAPGERFAADAPGERLAADAPGQRLAADAPGQRLAAHPALVPDADDPEPDAQPWLYTALAARGAHEIVVNSPLSVTSLADLTVEQVQLAVDVWRERMRAQHAAYVHVGVDERPEAGATPPHTHAQLLALGFVPAIVARERERYGAHAVRTMGGNLLEDLVQEEVRRRERIVAIDDEAVLLCPYAPRSAYALTIAPRRGRERFEDAGPSGAALLHEALLRLRRRFGASPPASIWVRTAPRDAERFCWRIEIVPRLAPEPGLELGAGVQVSAIAPERAAAELRDA